MKVLLANWYADRSGGADVYTEELAVGLAARGHAVTVVCHAASPRVEAACRVVRFPRAGAPPLPGAWRVAPLFQWADCERRLAVAPIPRPDVIVGSPVFALRALARRFPTVARVYLPHARIAPVEVKDALAGTSWLLGKTGFEVYRRLERWALLRSATTVRFTRGNADALRRFYRLPARVRFDIIPQAVPLPPTQNARCGFQLRGTGLQTGESSTGLETGATERGAGNAAEPRVLFVGRLVASKNVGLLIEALGAAADLPWQLDVVGDGPERGALEAIAARLGIGDRVAFHGHRDDVGPFYRATDLFAFPSKIENVSLVVLEAMAHGVPPLVVRADGAGYQNAHHEVITDGRDGLIAAGEAGFAAALRACLADPARLAALGAAARQTVADGHTWPAALNRWEEVLAELAPRAIPATPEPGAPALSVIVPTYNRAGFVRDCLVSLRETGVPDLEVVVTDDGSTDDTAAVVAATDPGAKYLWHPNTGSPTTPKNRGFAVSGGRYVGFLDCDDQWVPGAPARAVELLDRYPEVGLVFGDTLIGNEADGYYSLMATRDLAAFDAIPHREPEPGFRVLDAAEFYRRLTAQNQFSVCAAVLRRELFAAAGGFTPGMREAEDWDLWLRLCCRTTVGWMDRPIARYYVHPGGMSRDNWDGFDRGFCQALANALAGAAVTADQRGLLRRQYRKQLFDYAHRAYNAGRLADARVRFRAAVRAGNLRPATLALWLASHLPAELVRRARRLRRTFAGKPA